MLTSDHAIITFNRGLAVPDRLTRKRHAHYLEYAAKMLAVYRDGVGQTRRELHRAVEAILAAEPQCQPRRIASFCKLLDDLGEFDADKPGVAAKLRLEVFSEAAKYHPLVAEADTMFERTEGEVKTLIAQKLGREWSEIEPALYADVIDCQRLKAFDGDGSAEALLSRYNVAQLQACLYRAERLTIRARADFAAIVRYAKLARLLLDIRRIGADEYRLDLSGPATVLHETRRYGVNFARFLPALLACRGWSMEATIQTPWAGRARLKIDSSDGYASHVPSPEEFDSTVEERLAETWGEERDGWRLARSAGILHEGQHTFVPDFLFRHEDGREVFLEIVGFWTPEYLAHKRQTLRQFHRHRLLLAVPERTVRPGADEGPDLIVYKTRLKPEAVSAALARRGETTKGGDAGAG